MVKILLYSKNNMYIPIKPSFTTLNWGTRGSKLLGRVSMMLTCLYHREIPRLYKTQCGSW